MSAVSSLLQKLIYETLRQEPEVYSYLKDPKTEFIDAPTSMGVIADKAYQITDIDMRYIATDAVTVKDDGIITIEPYTFDRTTGTVIFDNILAGRNITISGFYYPIRVWDEIPQENINYPYVEIGVIDTNPDKVFGNNGEEVFVTMHIWIDQIGDHQGNKILQDIGKAIYRCLDAMERRKLNKSPLAISEYTLIINSFDYGTILKDIAYRQMPIRYKFLVREDLNT